MDHKLKKLISFNVHKRHPQTHARTKGKGMWMVQMHAQNADTREEVELENIEPCDLSIILPLVIQEFTEIVGTLSPITNASYTIYQKV